MAPLHLSADCPKWFIRWHHALLAGIGVFGDDRGDQRHLATIRSGDCWDRLLHRGNAIAFVVMGQGDDKRLRAVHDIAHDAFGYPPASCLGQRPLAREDRRARYRPVDTGCGHAPRLEFAGLESWCLRIAMRGLWPGDRNAVASCDQEKTLANCRRAVIAGPKLAPLDVVAAALQPADISLERTALAFRIERAVIEQRAPRLKLLDVFEDHHARTLRAHPVQTDQREPTNFLFTRLPSLCLRKMFAVR